MANDISHKVVGGYFALTFDAGTGITYDADDPDALKNRGVTISGDREVALVGAGEPVHGSIVAVEPTDGDSVKVTVQMGGALVFVNGTEDSPAVGSLLVGGGTDGDVVAATNGQSGTFLVTAVEGDEIIAVSGVGGIVTA